MINFLICEDEYRAKKMIRDIVNEYIENKKIEARIAVETSLPSEVLDYVKSNCGINNIYILDISLNDNINGLKLAKKIREYDIYGYIIFVTSYAELSLETFKYKLKALDYIIKDENVKDRLYEALEVAIEEYSKFTYLGKDKIIKIKFGSKVLTIPLNQIMYIQTSPVEHKLIMTNVNNKTEFYGTIKKIKEELDERFYQIHRSYIVNVNYIKEIFKERFNTYVIMKNNEKCPVSKKYIKGLVEHVGRNN